MKKINSLTILLITFLWGCNQTTSKSPQSITNDTLMAIENDSIIEKPILTNEIEIDSSTTLDFLNPNFYFGFGGGGVFTFDTTELVNNKFIFISSLNEDSALIKIDNKELFLIPDTYNSTPRKENACVDAWKGHGLSVILKLTFNDKGHEINAKGIMEIKNEKHTKKFKVYGSFEE